MMQQRRKPSEQRNTTEFWGLWAKKATTSATNLRTQAQAHEIQSRGKKYSKKLTYMQMEANEGG